MDYKQLRLCDPQHIRLCPRKLWVSSGLHLHKRWFVHAEKISQITMAYDSAESTYKIKQVNDPKLFYNNDYTLNDY